jgi:hemerythrin
MNSIRTANEQHLNSIRTANEQHLNTYKEELEEKEIKEVIKGSAQNFISNGTWIDEKKYFQIDEQWQYKICMSHKLKKDELVLKINEFLDMIELKEDYKSAKELKSHFVNWLNKKKSIESPEQPKVQTLRKLPSSPNSIR